MIADEESTNRGASALLRSTYEEAGVVQVVRHCREQIGGLQPTLVFVFVSEDWKPHIKDVIELIQIEGHATTIVGCSGMGFVGTGEENENVSGMSLLFLRLPQADVQRVMISESDVDKSENGKSWPDLTGLAPLDADAEEAQSSTWLTLVNPFRIRSETWLRQWNSAYPDEPVYGGLASGGSTEDEIFLFTESGMSDDAAIALRFGNGVRIGGVVSQGCRPIGEPFTITEVDDNVLVSIGSRRAFDVLEEAWESLEEDEQEIAQGNIFAGLAMSEYVDDFKTGDFLVRNILGGDPQAGVLALGAYPRVGQTLQFQIRDRDAADEEMRSECARAQMRYGQPFAGLMFSCAGRGVRMFGVPDHDAGIVEDVFGKMPFAGFFCNGEIGPVGPQNFIHGYTAASVFFLNP